MTRGAERASSENSGTAGNAVSPRIPYYNQMPSSVAVWFTRADNPDFMIGEYLMPTRQSRFWHVTAGAAARGLRTHGRSAVARKAALAPGPEPSADQPHPPRQLRRQLQRPSDAVPETVRAADGGPELHLQQGAWCPRWGDCQRRQRERCEHLALQPEGSRAGFEILFMSS